MASTQVGVTLALNVIIDDDDTGRYSIVYPLLALTRLMMLFWSIRQTVNQVIFTLGSLAQDLKNSVTGKVFAIGFNSIAWGVGL